MKKVIEYLKENWQMCIVYAIDIAMGVFYCFTGNWAAVMLTACIIFLLAQLDFACKDYCRVLDKLLEEKRVRARANSLIAEMSEKYAKLGIKYIKLREKYELEELKKELEVECKPHKRRGPKRCKKTDTQTKKS